MKYVAKTETGKVRENNEDSYFADNGLYILADGMGGHLAGEMASSMVTSIIPDRLSEKRSAEALIAATKFANSEIYKKSQENEKFKGMGTTLTLAAVEDNKINFINVGDSRIYRIDNRGIDQITKDDSFVNYLIEIGEITEEEATRHPKKNVLTKAIGTADDIDLEVFSQDIGETDKFLLCSDGLTNMVSSDRIEEIILNEDPNRACEILVEEALKNGGIDNITLILLYK